MKSAAGAPVSFCVECVPRPATTSAPVIHDSSYRSSDVSWTSSSATGPSWADQSGGTFGGGGASGGWDDAPASPGSAPAPDAAGFTPADYAAFDAATESDKNDGSPGYDS